MKKTYTITFKAELNEDDLKAMKSCFYDAMNESMEISEVWGLEIEEDSEDPAPTRFNHISDVIDYLQQMATVVDIEKTLAKIENTFPEFPAKFGSFEITNRDTIAEDGFVEICNSYWDSECSSYEDNYYTIDVVDFN